MGYFSFQKLITAYFVRAIYALGFIVLTVGGIGLAVWAGMQLDAKVMPTRLGVYYIAAGAGILIIGNLVWRMGCEFWLLLFNMQTLVASIEKEVRHPDLAHDIKQEVVHEEVIEVVHEEVIKEKVKPERRTYAVGGQPRGVLGLS